MPSSHHDHMMPTPIIETAFLLSPPPQPPLDTPTTYVHYSDSVHILGSALVRCLRKASKGGTQHLQVGVDRSSRISQRRRFVAQFLRLSRELQKVFKNVSKNRV